MRAEGPLAAHLLLLQLPMLLLLLPLALLPLLSPLFLASPRRALWHSGALARCSLARHAVTRPRQHRRRPHSLTLLLLLLLSGTLPC